jgi:uncharacterized protein (TIGR03437 family)
MKGAVSFLLAAVVSFPAVAAGQAYPVPLLGGPGLLRPAASSDGQTVVFGSAVTPSGVATNTTNLYVDLAVPSGDVVRLLTDFSGNPIPLGATAVSLSPDGTTASYTLAPRGAGQGEEVHALNTATGKDLTLVVDKDGCILPLAVCAGCFFTCLRTPHVSADAGKVLYTAVRQQPFYIVNTDGTGLTHLPVYSGALAPAPQRVISQNGLVAFSSSAPSGPTFAASAADVYVMNLAGTGLRNLTKFGLDTSIFAQNAVISADGATVVFESNYDPNSRAAGQVTQICAVNSDASQLRVLTADAAASTSPSVSADGRLAVFIQSGQVYMVSTSGQGRKTALTSFQHSAAHDPAISDDGAEVVFLAGPASGGSGTIYRVKTSGAAPYPVFAPPSLNPGGITGAAQFEPPSAGSFANVYGINFTADSMATADRLPLPTTLGGVSLLVNGQAVPLLAVTPWQVTAQLPQAMPEGQATFEIVMSGSKITSIVSAEVASVAPAVFVYLASGGDPGTAGTGVIQPQQSYWQAAAFHAGTAVPADPAHPAKAGETLEIYGTGLGKTDPMVIAGVASPASPPARSLFMPNVIIGDAPATVTFAGLVPGLAGVYQVNAVVPQGLAPGLQGLGWLMGDTGSITGSIAVQ